MIQIYLIFLLFTTSCIHAYIAKYSKSGVEVISDGGQRFTNQKKLYNNKFSKANNHKTEKKNTSPNENSIDDIFKNDKNNKVAETIQKEIKKKDIKLNMHDYTECVKRAITPTASLKCTKLLHNE